MLPTERSAAEEGGFVVEPLPDPPVLDLMEVRKKPEAVIDDDPAWPERLLALFEEAVLHDEAKRPRGINKWTGPIDLSLRGDAADDVAVYVEEIAAELSELIDLPIELYVDQNWAGDIDIYITYWKNYWPFFMQSTEPGRHIFTCAVLPWVDRGRIKRATIKINAGVLDRATVRACLLEELTQALGLFGETEEETETLLHDGIGYEGLGAIDRVLIRTLYDPRLTLGLSNERAATIASVILNEQLAKLVNGQSEENPVPD
ncbi:MAG: DUF2927 domain-containing protein [Geminicoccaceae bacterium]